MILFQYALKRSLANKVNLIFLLLLPILCLFMPAADYWPLLPFGYQYFGIFLMFVSIRLTSIILEDRSRGVVKRLAVAPITHLQYLSQNLLAYFVLMIVQCVVIVYGGLLYGQELFKPHLLLVLFLSFSLTSLAFALFWISFYRSKETSFLIFISLISLIALLGGILVPLDMMPELLQNIAIIFPTYWLSEGLTWIAIGEELMEFLLINGMLWLYALIFLIVGSIKRIH
ncbi:ABC transporter permease [Alkalihalobacillus trypoxylicola]|uniref:Multidrug ABC transporter permease n=1 Tax=Alkalihalobacillus trypoxylicola TaxID=519424 RepID=A0A162DHC3_9BACI|nr:ABC transporter permease [Alkalihalobacillus trypoxylicola]KYG29636.1 multidrug ABC transporter permease [Alkalihalobacillus trypoxylicola]